MFHETIVTGRVGTTPEMRYTTTGTPVTGFSVAVNERWTDRDGQAQERTTWYKVTAWGKLAETCSQYLEKGRLVLVAGTMQEPSVWTGRDGNPRASLELRANTVKFLGSRNDNGALPGDNGETVEDMTDIPF